MGLITKEEKEFFRTCSMEVAEVMVQHENAVDCLAALKKWREENVWTCPVEVLNDFNKAIEIIERTCQDELDNEKATQIKELIKKIESLTPGIAIILTTYAGGNAEKALPILKVFNEHNDKHLSEGILSGEQLESALRLQKDFPAAIQLTEEILKLKGIVSVGREAEIYAQLYTLPNEVQMILSMVGTSDLTLTVRHLKEAAKANQRGIDDGYWERLGHLEKAKRTQEALPRAIALLEELATLK